jgi:hypothetical protein
MKKNGLFLAMLGIVLAFGLLVTGCDNGNNNGSNGGGGNPFIGTWIGTDSSNNTITIVFAESTFTETQEGSVSGICNGTYTYSGNIATLTMTAVNGGLTGYVSVGYKTNATINGNSITINDATLTKS